MHRIALVGAGRIGRIHAANLAAAPQLQLCIIVDPMPGSAAEVAAATGAKVATFDAALADPEIAGLVIASSTDTHLDYSLRAIEAGKAVLCEKPLDLDLAKARAAAPILGRAGAPEEGGPSLDRAGAASSLALTRPPKGPGTCAGLRRDLAEALAHPAPGRLRSLLFGRDGMPSAREASARPDGP